MLILKNSTMIKITKTKLQNICALSFGQYIKASNKKGIPYLQVKNFSDNGMYLNNVDSYVNADEISENILLRQDEILFVSKGMKFFAFKYDKEMGDAVASSIFYIIKVDSTVVLPDYVTCILNHSKSISYFNQVSAGSSIPSIRKKELLDFEIPIHSMEMQKKIVDMYKIHKKEIEILEQLKEKKQVLFNQIINNFSK